MLMKIVSSESEKQMRLPAFITLTYFTVIFAVIVVAYGEVARRAQTNELAYSVKDKQIYLSDFVQFYTCGKLVLDPATRLKVYDPRAINQAMPVGIPPEDRIIPAVPFFIVLMAPWALLPLNTSFIVWILLSAAAMAAGSFILLKDLKGASNLAILGFLAAILVAQPSWFTLFIGHACLFQYFFLCLFFWGLHKKNDWVAGAGMALASFKPQYAIGLAIPALAEKRFKLLAWGACFELCLLGLAVATVGLDNTIHFPSLITKYEHDQSRVVPRMICLRAILERFLPHQPTMIISWLLFGGSLLLAFVLWRQARSKPSLMPWAAAFTIVSALLFSPHAHVYDAVMMGIAAIFVLPTSGFFGFKQQTALKSWLSLTLMAYPLISWYFFVGIGIDGQMVGYPFALLHLIILLAILAIFKAELAAPAPEQTKGEIQSASGEGAP
jgi:Glycosyltransferase family 87